MVNIQVRDVPREVHAKLRERAAAAGQSLQEYLIELLARDAATLTNAELAAEIERKIAEHPDDFFTGRLDEIATAVREQRTAK